MTIELWLLIKVNYWFTNRKAEKKNNYAHSKNRKGIYQTTNNFMK